ncbi:MAG: nucleoside triphosphate pyrophosphohydrolase [Muribaculaceae bacterium]|nr:nucleoside triphosphate pyrophosphohydrolase [Muribaculaceae bacterium]
MPNNSKEAKLQAFSELLDVMDTLRARCPWDSVQTKESIRPNTIEETMELAEAIIENDHNKMRKELGDVLLHIVFYSVMGNEDGHFDIADVCNSLVEKLKFRHPHIYGETKAENAQQVRDNWEVIKMKEKDGNKSILSGVPSTLPSLIKAERVQEKAANVGFDWENREDVWDKVKEEIAEVEQEIKAGNAVNTEKEFGDLFFALVNAARLYDVRPDNALERTNHKFIARFNHIEKRAKEEGLKLNEMTLAQMDKFWDEAKALHLGEKV